MPNQKHSTGRGTAQASTGSHQKEISGYNQGAYLFTLSAPEQAATTRMAESLAGRLCWQNTDETGRQINIKDLAYILAKRRSEFYWRCAAVAEYTDDLSKVLQ
jgi:acyl transferase domain-containing protein